MAQALYREWFVDFHYPGHEGEALVDSELGTIPEGWVAAPLFDVAEPTFGFAFESKQFNSEGVGNPVIRIRDLPRNRTETSTTEVAGTQYEVSDGDVLIGMDGIFHMCRWSAGPAYLNQRVVRFRPADDRLSRYQIHLGLERPIRELNETIVGTTVAHLGKRHLQRLHLPVPPEPLRSHARGVFDPLLDQVILLRKSTATLRGTRDLLLPRLISGELDVSGLDLDLRDLVA
jgi:type I restriction enzyme S subunit